MLRPDIEKKRRNHRNRFLPGKVADFGFVHEEVLEFFKRFLFAHSLTRRLELPSEAVWIPASPRTVSAEN